MKTLGFIGCGHIAKSLIIGLKRDSDYEIIGYDKMQDSLDWLKINNCTPLSLDECCNNADILFLCVKPQDMPTLCKELSAIVNKNQSIVSVAAGIKYESLKNSLPTDKIFRAMPNVGAKDNLGITAIFSHSDNSEILRIFKFLGEAYEVENEDQIDLHTVLIGSGPAFFYELLSEFERRMDILVQDKDIKRLISIIFLSSLITSIKNGENLDDLIESVASKGGTTEAGLNFLYKEKFNEIFSGAVDAGVKRAKELSMD